MRIKTTGAALALLLALGACGDTFGEQALLGGGVGAAAAVATDSNVAAGALVGAAGNVAYCNAYPQNCR